jgi:hypothetical protein
MAKVYTGRDGSMILDGIQVAKVVNWSIQADMEALETTTLGDVRRSFTPGIISYSGSCTVLYYKDQPNPGNETSATRLLKKLFNTSPNGYVKQNGSEFTLRLTDSTDNNDLTFNAFITSASIGASVGEVVSASVSFQVNGDLIAVSM